jgi:hypothetical protein
MMDGNTFSLHTFKAISSMTTSKLSVASLAVKQNSGLDLCILTLMTTEFSMCLISIAAGSVSFNYNNLFNGLRPTRVVIGFVDSEAAAGNYTLDPFNFQHFSLRQITLKLNLSTFWKTASTEQVPCFIRLRYDPFSIKFGSTSKQYKEHSPATSELSEVL